MKKGINIYIGIVSIILFLLIISILIYRTENFYQKFSVPKTKETDTVKTLKAKDVAQNGQKMQLYVLKTDNTLGQQVEFNTKKAMDYAHLHYKNITANEIKGLTPSPYTGIIITGEIMAQLPQADIQNFVQVGGRIIIANRLDSDSSWNTLFGITKKEGFKDVKGLTFEEVLFPGYPDLSSSSPLFTHSSMNITLDENTTNTWITAEDTPILWTNDYGEGKVLYWNTTALNDKLGRGMFVQSLGTIFPTFATVQLGAEIMYIDDFPSPIPSGELKNLTTEKISVEEFYKKHWWKNMKDISEELDIKYTGVAIGTYQNKVTPPFENFTGKNRNTYLLFGRELLSHGGEIGIHGYNHQPLLLPPDPVDKALEYVPWNSKEDMERSLDTLQKLVYNFFPNEKLKTYVPPSNIINTTGLSALNDAVPTMETVASLYVGSKSNGSLIQEFGPDEHNKNIYHFPRITSGYAISDEEQFILADVTANLGVISHFVHPDDILDEKRSGNLTWEELFKAYKTTIKEIRERYPYIKSMTQSEATASMKIYQTGDLAVSYEDDAVHIAYKGLPNHTATIIRVEEGKKLKTGSFPYGTVTKLDSQIYSVILKQANATIPIKGV